MNILTRLLSREPEIKDPVDQRPLLAETFAPDNYPRAFSKRPATHHYHDGFGDALHSWVEKRIQAIEATCTECGKVELHSDHRGRLKGQKVPSQKMLGAEVNPRLAKLVVTPRGARRGPRPQNVARNEEWRRYYEAGQTVASIAATYEVNPRRVYDALRSMGVSMVGNSRRARKSPNNPERAAEMLRLREEEFLTYEQIGERYGISRERVRQVLRSQGADLRALDSARRATLSPKRKQPRICDVCGNEMRSMADSQAGIGETYHEHVVRYHHALMGLGTRSTPEENEIRRQIADDYVAGVAEADIHAKYGVKATTVTYSLLQNGLVRNRRSGRRLPTLAGSRERAALILADTAAGMNAHEIARKHGVSPTLVYQIRKQVGLTGPTRSRITPEQVKEMVALYHESVKPRQIARRMGVAPSTVARALRKEGVMP